MRVHFVFNASLILGILFTGCSDDSFRSARIKGSLTHEGFANPTQLPPESSDNKRDVQRIPPPDVVAVDENGDTVIWGPGLTTAHYPPDAFMVEDASSDNALNLFNSDANLMNCATDACESSVPLYDQNAVNHPQANVLCGPTSMAMMIKKLISLGYRQQSGLHKQMDDISDSDTLIKYITDKTNLRADGISSIQVRDFLLEYSKGLGNKFSVKLQSILDDDSLKPEYIASMLRSNSLGIMGYGHISRTDSGKSLPIDLLKIVRNGGHFVVITGYKKSGDTYTITVNDPWGGVKREYPLTPVETFSSLFNTSKTRYSIFSSDSAHTLTRLIENITWLTKSKESEPNPPVTTNWNCNGLTSYAFPLAQGDSSCNENYSLIFQHDGNLVL